MDCLCGCKRRIGKDLVEFNFQAGEIGVELLAWDKARATLDPRSEDRGEIDRIIDAGARSYQQALGVLHGERPPYPLEQGEDWLAASRGARREMARTRPFVPKGRIKPTEEDFARYDPLRPERSFTGSGLEADPSAAPEESEQDLVAQLDGLRRLHLQGALTDEEFAAAKARVIDRM